MAISETLGLTSDASVDSQPAPTEDSVDAGHESELAEEAVPAGDDVGDSLDDGTVVVEAPEIDMDVYGDQLVSVKIGGETQYVPLKEAASGYQRQADYTRKTQELAAQAAQNERALKIAGAYDQDPTGFIHALAGLHQVNIGSPESTTASEQEYQTPEEKMIAELTAQVNELQSNVQATQAQTVLERQVADLESEVGDVDRDVLYQHMAVIGTDRPDVAWAHLNKDAALSGRAVSANQAAKAKVVESKREAQIVHRPSTGAAQSQSKTSSESPTNVREASQMAENNVEAPPLSAALGWIRGL